MQTIERLLNAHQIRFAEPAANIHVTRDQGDAMCHGGKSANQNKLDLG
jgi:hypothetical protein